MLFDDLRRRGCRKVLAFCERRAECEELARRFSQGTPFGDRVFVHHANLDARVRRSVERDFATAEAALCFATSTLELGIDIGDVDLVILIGPPDGVSSFLQRTGRGNRRTLRTRVICFYRDATEQALFHVLLRHAMSGQVEPSDYFFRSSVVVQQLCSYIKQTRFGEIEPAHAFELFHSPAGVPLISRADYNRIIEHLVSNDYFAAARGSALRPARKWQELYEQRAIYANLSDMPRNSLDVIDETTGRRLGQVTPGIMSPRAGRTFLLGGHVRRAVVREGRRLIVRASDDTTARALPSRIVRRSIRPWLARSLAAELGLPRPDAATGITMLVTRTDEEQIHDFSNADRNHQELPEGGERAGLLHCAGEVYAVVLGDLLEELYEVAVVAHTGLHLALRGALPAATLLQFSHEQVGARVVKRWRELERSFDLGSFQSELPPEVRRANVVTAFNVPEFLRLLSGYKVNSLTVTSDE
jgi:replicative superfamily II helicase